MNILKTQKTTTRTVKVIYNTALGLLNMVVTMICGFISAQITLRFFGSAYNGLTTSIGQFLGIISLLQMGISGVVQAALYKPLADNDLSKVAIIVRTTERFMRQLALIFLGIMLAVACFYPLLVQSDFNWGFVFTFTLVIGMTTFVQYFFGITYSFLLYADQRQAFSSVVGIVVQIISVLVYFFAVKIIIDIRLVKFLLGLIGVAGTLFIFVSARKRYKISRDATPDNSVLKNRWDAFGQHIAYFINNNTDIIILTIFTNVREISVYSVHFMVVHGMYGLFNPLVSAVTATFGNMFASKEFDKVSDALALFEQVVFSVATVLFGVTMVMLNPFIKVYTADITDVNYNRLVFAILISLMMFINSLRSPYVAIVYSLGHFKETRKAALIEMTLNIAFTLALVWKFGIVGAITGTIIAYAYRFISYARYVSREILHRRFCLVLKRFVVAATLLVVLFMLSMIIPIDASRGYSFWILKSAIMTALVCVMVVLAEYTFYRDDLFKLFLLIQHSFIKSRS